MTDNTVLPEGHIDSFFPKEEEVKVNKPVIGLTTAGEPITMMFVEFHALATLLQPFQELSAVFNSIRDRNINEGTIIPYTQDCLQEGTTSFTKEFQEFLESKRNKEETKEKPKKAKPVDKDLLK